MSEYKIEEFKYFKGHKPYYMVYERITPLHPAFVQWKPLGAFQNKENAEQQIRILKSLK